MTATHLELEWVLEARRRKKKPKQPIYFLLSKQCVTERLFLTVFFVYIVSPNRPVSYLALLDLIAVFTVALILIFVNKY